MNIYDDILDATVVSLSATGHFTTSKYEELLAVKTNMISVYRVSLKGRLILTNEFKFQGKITDIATIPQKDSELDCLLLCTALAKLSVVRYDELHNTVETLSLHYYEEKFKDISLLELTRESSMRIDPIKRCVVLFNNDVIALLPLLPLDLNEEEEEDGDEKEDGKGGEMEENAPRAKRPKPNKERFTAPSTIFPINHLHQDIRNVIDVQFLRNFTRPTLAIMYETRPVWAGNSQLTPFPITYIAFTLDITLNEISTEVKSTVIAVVKDLSWDFHTMIPINNGCILIGSNELAYIDNTGSLQSVILLNSYANKEIKKARILDRTKSQILLNKPISYSWSHSKERKEETLLMMDHEAAFYYILLDYEGRLLTKFDIINLPIVNDTLKDNFNPTCISRLNSTLSGNYIDLFVGFLSGNASVLRLNNLKSAVESREEHKETASPTEIDGEKFEDEDDLYSEEASDAGRNNESKEIVVETVSPFDIEVLSYLRNVGPITSLTSSKICSVEKFVKGLSNPNRNEMSLVATSGNFTGSHLTEIQISVRPEVQLALKFISITQMWNLKIKNKDKYLITTDSNKKKSDIYLIDKNFALYKEGRFRRDATTVSMSMFGGDKRIVQVTINHLYLYDTNFRRLTTMKFEYEVVHVSVMDPYILITVSRGDIKVYELDSKHKKKLFRVELPDILREMIITSGVILRSNMCNEFLTGLENSSEEQLLFTFVSADNQIIFFPREHNDRIFQLSGVDQLQEMLYISTYSLPDEVVPDPSIKQVMINKLGHNNKEEYLTILTFGGEVYQYKKSSRRHSRFYRNIAGGDLTITGAPDNAYAKGVSSIERVMHYIPEYNGCSVILITGNVPYIMVKEDDSVPRLFKFANIPLVSLTRWGKHSVMCVDDIKNARVYTLDRDNMYYGNKLPLRKINISNAMEDYMTLTRVTYHERSQMFIVCYAKEIEYNALGEDGVKLVGYKDNFAHAKSFKSGVLLVNPKTWNVIDKREFSDNSLINDARTMMIQLDSRTRRRKEYVIVGVAKVETEDLPSSGSLSVFDITEVVPEPGKPDTNFKLSEVFKEDIRGIVSSVCDISGRFLINQSQKVIVRDVQEDNSVVPVAFLDIPVFVTDVKSFGNFLIIGDSMQGFQFIGFDAEPYRMIPLGRSVSKLETVSLEFLVNGGDIFFAVTDTKDILHLFKYAPDEPNSLSGQRLVHCTSFNLHSTNTCMVLLPRNEEFAVQEKSLSPVQVIGGQSDGSVFKLVPLREDAYRRLYVLQQQITEKEVQLGGLNPRMERLSNEFYQSTHAVRPMLDFNVIRRFNTLSVEKRKVMAQKAGRRAHFEIWRDLINIEFSLRSLCG
ncbi:probable protein CFT1 [Zygosaccharomyces bailii]|nr:probable protein CFT1 [Zygosaccharomyces bailii]